MAGTGSTRSLRAVKQGRPCARCGAEAVDTVEHRHTFRYGAGASAANLTVDLPVRRCRTCGFEFLDRESERIKLEAICDHLGVLSPCGIRGIREGYGMTQAEFAEVTGLGTATLVRWENGSMNHTRAYDRYIRLLENRDVMRQLRELVEPAAPGRDSITIDNRWRALREDRPRGRPPFSLRRSGRQRIPAQRQQRRDAPGARRISDGQVNETKRVRGDLRRPAGSDGVVSMRP